MQNQPPLTGASPNPASPPTPTPAGTNPALDPALATNVAMQPSSTTPTNPVQVPASNGPTLPPVTPARMHYLVHRALLSQLPPRDSDPLLLAKFRLKPPTP